MQHFKCKTIIPLRTTAPAIVQIFRDVGGLSVYIAFHKGIEPRLHTPPHRLAPPLAAIGLPTMALKLSTHLRYTSADRQDNFLTVGPPTDYRARQSFSEGGLSKNVRIWLKNGDLCMFGGGWRPYYYDH